MVAHENRQDVDGEGGRRGGFRRGSGISTGIGSAVRWRAQDGEEGEEYGDLNQHGGQRPGVDFVLFVESHHFLLLPLGLSLYFSRAAVMSSWMACIWRVLTMDLWLGPEDGG